MGEQNDVGQARTEGDVLIHLPADEAARDIALDAYADWSDAERICVTVKALYEGILGRADGLRRHCTFHGHGAIRTRARLA